MRGATPVIVGAGLSFSMLMVNGVVTLWATEVGRPRLLLASVVTDACMGVLLLLGAINSAMAYAGFGPEYSSFLVSSLEQFAACAVFLLLAGGGCVLRRRLGGGEAGTCAASKGKVAPTADALAEAPAKGPPAEPAAEHE